MPCELRFGSYADLDAKIMESSALYFDEVDTGATITIANGTESDEECVSEQLQLL